MALPTHTFEEQKVKYRRGESYVSAATNRSFLGWPYGCYLGFTPSVTAGSLVLTLNVDPTYLVSFARVLSGVELVNVDVVLDQAVTLDFDGHDFGADPTAYVMVSADVGVGSATTATIFTRATPPVDESEQLLCVVTKPGDDLVADFDDPTNRSSPYAHASAPLGYGFMKANAVEELIASVAMVSEVQAAREDLTGFVHPFPDGLNDRIGADLAPAAIAGRLGLGYRVVRSNDHSVGIDTSELNVSSSFTETARTALPISTLDGNGSETSPGVITDSDAEERNICFVTLVDAASKNTRPVGGGREVVFGRLFYTETNMLGTLTFSNVSTTVTGVGTNFLDSSQVSIGDIILAPDGLYYTVSTITDAFTLDLDQIPAVAGPAVPGPLDGTTRRRWLLRTFIRAESGEINFSMSTGTVVRFYSGGFFSLLASFYDASLEMFLGGEEPPMPDAAVGVEGKVLMHPSLTDALAGAVQTVQLRGGPVGTGVPAYSVNFDGAADGGSGTASVSMAGPTGAQGAPGTGTGPPGPAGPAGSGFDAYSSPFNSAFFASPHTPATKLVHTVVFPGPIKYLHGGMYLWSLQVAAFMDLDDHFDIVTTDTPSGTTGRIESQVPATGIANADIGLFLSAAG